jgi:hypothetical protein
MKDNREKLVVAPVAEEIFLTSNLEQKTSFVQDLWYLNK